VDIGANPREDLYSYPLPRFLQTWGEGSIDNDHCLPI
jgi:hypothetical protein